VRPLVLTLALILPAAAGCGGGHKAPRQAPRDAGGVIRAWADDLRAGRYDAANRRFAVPATVANGGPPMQLRTARQVDAFDRGFPCGAVVTDARRISGGRILTTFRLTDLAGHVGSCGSGAGHQAQVTFRVRGGRITEWLRVGDAPPGSTEV
jgi:hypothetical protein